MKDVLSFLFIIFHQENISDQPGSFSDLLCLYSTTTACVFNCSCLAGFQADLCQDDIAE